MQAVNYSTARNNLKSIMEDVCNNFEEYIITNKDDNNVVILSLDEYNAMKETMYLLSTPANRDRLLKAVEDAESGTFEPKELIE
jgi:antitoxin YefM